jgi:sugar phosphate permease
LLGVVWSFCWYSFGASSPELHLSITEEERAYIIETRGNTGNKVDTIPWFKLFTSFPVLAVVVAHTTHNWLFYTMLTWMPSYLNQVLGFDVENSGAVSVMPYLACFACSMISGVIADKLTKSGMKVERVRKVMQFSGEMTAGIALGVAGYINDNIPLVIFLLVLSTGASGLSMAGYACNHLDIAPQFAGITLGMTNTMATLPGIIAPILVGDLVAPPHDDIVHWREAFLIASGISTFGFVFFFIFAKGEALPELTFEENSSKIDDDDEEEEENSKLVK